MYSKEEIERKRLEALKRKQEKTTVASSFAGATSKATNVPQNNVLGMNFSNTSLQTKSQRLFKEQGMSNRYHPMKRPSDFYGQITKCEATCTMISNDRFTVETSAYNQKLIELFKTIPTRLYDLKLKTWNFHLIDYEMLQQKVLTLQSEVTFKTIPSFVLRVFKNSLSKEKEPKKTVNFSQIDSCLINSLYPFQKEGIEFAILNEGKCLIADDMGLGKTRQALGVAHYFKKDWPLIIVSPSSVRYQWSEAIIESLPSVPVHAIQHINNTKDFMEKSQVTIISYDLLVRRIDEISARKFGVLICDESHYLKSAKTQRTKAVQQLASNCSRIILLTGTPALSRPMELHPQLKIVMPGFMSYKDFGMRYCAGVQTKFGWDFSGSSNLKELDLLLKATCLIRRLKCEVMTQLPSKIRQKIILDPQQIKASKDMEAASKELESTKRGIEKHTLLLEYFSTSSKAKEKAVCNYITDLVENKQKFLVFAHHKNMLDAIANLLDSQKIKFIRIDGKTNPEQRKHFVDQFQNNENILVAVLSITAANAGITLTAAQIVVFAELYWNPGILTQAEDRVHRIGQTENVVIRYLIAKETVDDYFWPAIQKKINILNEVGLEQNLDLDKADEENQQSSCISDQPKIENFLTLSSDKQSANTSTTELLDIDDDAFLDIDMNQF